MNLLIINITPGGHYDLSANKSTTLLVLLASGREFRMWQFAKSEIDRGRSPEMYSEEIDRRLVQAAAEALAERIDDGGAL
jgi:hypothetical protein